MWRNEIIIFVPTAILFKEFGKMVCICPVPDALWEMEGAIPRVVGIWIPSVKHVWSLWTTEALLVQGSPGGSVAMDLFSGELPW